MMQRKDEIVTKLTGGVAHLFKHNKVESIHGKGKLISANEVEVTKLKGLLILSLPLRLLILIFLYHESTLLCYV